MATRPTGGGATPEDVAAGLTRGRDIAVFSDEPYCHIARQGAHCSIAVLPGMLDQVVACVRLRSDHRTEGGDGAGVRAGDSSRRYPPADRDLAATAKARK
jgi:hypothetical protein